MVNKIQAYQLIRNRLWILQHRAHKSAAPEVITFAKEEDDSFVGFFSVIFHENGELEVPTNVGFVPKEYGKWDFDETSQKIIFVGTDGKPKIRASLPEKLPYGSATSALKLQLSSSDNDSENMFINDPHLDHFAITKRTNKTYRTFFIPRTAFDYPLFGLLRWNGFNVKIIDHAKKTLDFFNGVYEYLVLHPQIEDVVISRQNIPKTAFSTEHKLAFQSKQNQVSFDYLSGKRAAIIEFLVMVLSEDNLRQFGVGDQLDDETMLYNVINTYFSGRYDLIELSNL